MTPVEDSLATAFFAEILAVDQQAKTLLARGLPKGMELSQFVVLNHLAHLMAERTPAQLAQTFHVTRGAMTNTLGRLEGAGYVHIRPDWDDARRKLVVISPAGRAARDQALATVMPHLAGAMDKIGREKVRAAVPVLRQLREKMAGD